ncbi:MAG: NAD(P)-binding domain-containing protein [Planctomycetota bacterium]
MLRRFARWLHTGWPAGTVEKLPRVNADGSTAVPGLFVVGDLTGVPLLKFAAETGAKAVARACDGITPSADEAVRDLVIIGGGVSGMAAALEARRRGLRFEVLEAAEPFDTIVNFPKAKPIFTYPTDMTPAGELQFTATVKEPLLDELREQTKEIVVRRARVERVVRIRAATERERGHSPATNASNLQPSGAVAQQTRHNKSHDRQGVDVVVGASRSNHSAPATTSAPLRSRLLRVELADGEPAIVAQRVIVAIGRSGNFRKLGVPGESLSKVSNRLHDPRDFAGQNVLVVGGGDSALETAIALVQGGAAVTLSYRGQEFSRPKPANVAALEQLQANPRADVAVEHPTSDHVSTATGRWVKDMHGAGGKPFADASALRVEPGSTVTRIDDATVSLKLADGREESLPNDAVFSMIGRDAPLEFFRQSGVPIAGERNARWWIALIVMLLFCIWLYHWKKGGSVLGDWYGKGFPYNLGEWFAHLGGSISVWADDPSTWLGALISAAKDPGFFYSLAYCLLVIVFGIRRIRRRKTPYVRLQTVTLMAFQVIPLFLLPYLVFPWMGHNGYFDSGAGRWFAQEFFPEPLPEIPVEQMKASLTELERERVDLQRGLDEGWGTAQDLANKRVRIADIAPVIQQLRARTEISWFSLKTTSFDSVSGFYALDAFEEAGTYTLAKRATWHLDVSLAEYARFTIDLGASSAAGDSARTRAIARRRDALGSPLEARADFDEWLKTALRISVDPAMARLQVQNANQRINKAIASVHVAEPHSYWRSFGFILAWPLFVYNIFTDQPITGWLILGLIQTFVIIPLIVWKWGKGAYCGWICSCGALAETLGDAHRHKMPHGPKWNRLNLAGQVILGIGFIMLGLRIAGWLNGSESDAGKLVNWMLYSAGGGSFGYAYLVDLVLAGIIGVALYFHFSGRVWCRFFCPLAALMHIYARFSRFRIVAEKKKCISCNVCTSVCHQGIDVMNFANKGIPMADPQCVRCSACVQSCPTGVLQFGEVNRKGEVIRTDRLSASTVRIREV